MSIVDYHLRELEIALDPSHPDHYLPPIAAGDSAILDLGCGIGQTLVACNVSAETLAVGMDIDPEPLAYARAHYPQYRYIHADASGLPFKEGSFDLVFARATIAYSHIPTVVREIARVLKPGGRTWLSFHTGSFQCRSLRRALRSGQLRTLLSKVYAVANGLLFHWTGWLVRHPLHRSYESFQTASRMRKLLIQAGFTDLHFDSGKGSAVLAFKPSLPRVSP